ncbi:hypothetical protein N9515_10000 [Vicingaceae bacterium]|nr:hypothetical protein [Vicingaceae bacterium]
MAEILEVKTVVDTTAGEKSLESIVKKMDTLLDAQDEQLKNQEAIADATKEAGTKGVSSIKKLASGFKGVGLAIKAAGIGLLVGVFQTIKTLFEENQKVADLFSTAMKGLQIVFNDFVNLITDNAQPVVDFFKAIFDDPIGSIKDFGNAVKENLIERFNSYLDTLGFVAKAIKQVFERDFSGALESIKQAGKESIDVLTGVNNSFDKGVEIVTEATEAVTEYAKETYNSAAALVEQEKAMARSETTSRMLQLSYQKQAEDQRQIRDDETKTFAERIAANEELGRILKEAAEVEKAEVQTRIDNLQKEQELLGFKQETADEIYALTVEQLDIDERLGGIKSEQLTNENSLLREQKDVVSELALLGKDEFDRQTLEAEQEKIRREEEATLAIEDAQALADALVAIDTEYNNQINEIDENRLKAKTAIDDAEKAMLLGRVQAAGAAIGQLGALFEKGTAASKAAAIAEIAIGTGVGFIQGLDIAQKTAAAGGPLAGIIFPTFYATQIAAVLGAAAKAKSILSTAKGGGGSGSTPSAPSVGGARPSTETPRIPNFNAQNQGVGGRDGFGSVRAVVIQQDIKDSASLDNRVDDLVKIGK